MNTADIVKRERRRKQWLKRAVAGALVAVAGGLCLVYWVGRLRTRPPGPTSVAVPRGVKQQVSGFTFTRWNRGHRVFRIHAARTLEMKKSGTATLQDVFVEFFGQAGDRHDILRTRQGQYDPVTGNLSTSQSVQLELNVPWHAPGKEPSASTEAKFSTTASAPMMLETSQVSFSKEGSVVETQAPVNFRLGPLTGTAAGLAYSTQDGAIDLVKDISAQYTPSSARGTDLPIHLVAGHFRYDKPAGKAWFDGGVEVSQGTRRVTADRATLALDGGNRVTALLLTGRVEARDTARNGLLRLKAPQAHLSFDPRSNSLQELEAQGGVEGAFAQRGNSGELRSQSLRLEFAGRRARAVQGDVGGGVRLTLALGEARRKRVTHNSDQSDLSAAEETLTCQTLHLVFRPDGRSLRQAATEGPGELKVAPRDPKTGRRVVTAGEFTLDFDKMGRAETLRGKSGTRIVFDPPQLGAAGALAAVTTGQELVAHLDPQTETIRSAEQSGDFHFEQGAWKGSAVRADYSAPEQAMLLTGNAVITDGSTKALADRVRLNLRDDTARGVGHVQATHIDPDNDSVLPTNVLADRVTVNRRADTARYEGHIRAWRSADVMESPALVVDQRQKKLRASSGVVTTFLGPAPAGAGAGAKALPDAGTRPVVIRADRLNYLDATHRASYEGHVALVTENTVLNADRMDVEVAKAGNAEGVEVQRVTARGHVVVTQPGRRATGDRAEYSAAEGKIVMTGGPPRLEDASQGSVSGQRLTFFIHSDRLLVDGGNGSAVSTHRVAQ